MSMKVTGIINRGFTQFNRLKYAKVTEDISAEGVSPHLKRAGTESFNIFDNERGALKNSEISLVKKIKKDISSSLKLISSPAKEIRSKVLTYDPLLDSPDHILALKFKNPKYTAMSGSVKTLRGEEYLDFILHGYFGDKKRFLINRDGEIIKSVSPKFFTNEPLTAMDKEPVYYSQHEINNLGLGRFIDIFSKEIKKLNDYIKLPIIPASKPVAEKKPPFDRMTFMYKQREALDKIHKNFAKLYYGILNNSRSGIQRRKLSDICEVTLHKKFPLMQINNINKEGESVQINFSELANKPVVRFLIFSPNEKINRLFIDGQLVEEASRDGSNPFTVGRIAKFYTPYETSELNLEKLFKEINDKIIYSLGRLRGVIGSYRIDK